MRQHVAGAVAGLAIVGLAVVAPVAGRIDTAPSSASPGCHASNEVAPGERRVTMISSATKRSYRRHVPPAARAGKPLPVVIDLHGYMEPAGAHEANSALGPFGDEHGFVTITPEGSGPVPHWDTAFDSADMRYFGDLLDDVERTLCLDEQRVYVSGYSNGAFMASSIACVYAGRVAAVAPVAGIRAVPGCTPARPVPVIAFHGTADGFVAFTGGLGPRVDALAQPDQQRTRDVAAPSESGLSIPQVAAAWAARNGCAPTPVHKPVADDVSVVSYRCPRRADVQLYEIAGAGHTWPGSRFSKAIEQYVGPTTFSIDADALIWRFFERHRLTLTGPARRSRRR
jgi:polyhydroxybutyrate depolymerase